MPNGKSYISHKLSYLAKSLHAHMGVFQEIENKGNKLMETL